MPFIEHGSSIAPTIGRPIALSRSHIDPATLILTFHYREWVHDGQQWNWQPRQQVLTLHTHFRIDKRRGVIELLDHAFWNQIGRWAAGDREEPLLYKGQVKQDRGQHLVFTYEHFASEEVDDPSTVDLEEIDIVASTRLGYNVPKYSPNAKETVAIPSWDWEKA